MFPLWLLELELNTSGLEGCCMTDILLEDVYYYRFFIGRLYKAL